MKAIVLLSGGADSRLLLRRIANVNGPKNTLALFCDYGQLMPEKAAARVAAHHEGTPFLCKSFPYTPPSHLTDVYHQGNPHTTEKVPESWVPGRNLMLASIALSIGEAMGADAIYFGFNAEDAESYPDCSHEFMEHINHLSTKCTGRRMAVSAPFINQPKAAILAELEKEGLTEEDYISGYPETRLADD